MLRIFAIFRFTVLQIDQKLLVKARYFFSIGPEQLLFVPVLNFVQFTEYGFNVHLTF